MKVSKRTIIIISVGIGIFIIGLFFNFKIQYESNTWNTITGSIISWIIEPIYNNLAQQAVNVGECVDQRDGSLENFNAYQAFIGNIECEP